MIPFLVRRTAAMVATILGVAMAVSLVLTVLPGDAARLMVGPEATPERYERARQALGLDQPWPMRFVRWLGRAVRGDLGMSFRYPGFSVGELLLRGLSVTFPVAAAVAFLSFGLGVLLGALATARLGGPLDLLLSSGSQTLMVVPEFWLGVLLVGLFSVRLGWLPAGGFPGWGTPRAWLHLLLPMLTLSLSRIAYFARLSRAALADLVFADFVRTARAKGLGEGRVLLRHMLRNALVPLVAGLGLSFARLLAGALVVEQVFSLPGLGRLAVDAAFGRDLPLLLGLSALAAATVAVVSSLADVTYGLLDPRIRYA